MTNQSTLKSLGMREPTPITKVFVISLKELIQTRNPLSSNFMTLKPDLIFLIISIKSQLLYLMLLKRVAFHCMGLTKLDRISSLKQAISCMKVEVEWLWDQAKKRTRSTTRLWATSTGAKRTYSRR